MTDNATGTARTYNYYYKNDGSEDRVEITGEISGYLKKTTDKQGRTTNLKVEFDNSVRFYGYKYQKRYYAVEPDGRLEEVELPSGEITNYTYDKLGRVSEHRITFPGTGEQVVTGSGSSGTSVSREDYFIRERYDYQRGANNDRTTEYVSIIQYLGNGYNASTVTHFYGHFYAL